MQAATAAAINSSKLPSIDVFRGMHMQISRQLYTISIPLMIVVYR